MSSITLPKGWTSAYLEDCVEILDAMRVPLNSDERQNRIAGKKDSELFPYFGATGEVGKVDDYLFDEELVALGEDGVPFFDAQKNKAYLLTGKTWVNNHAHVLKAFGDLTTNHFILNFLNQFDYHGFVNGGTRLKLTQASMRKIPLLLPPLAEQQQIAQKLDELLAQVDTLKTHLDTIPKILKRFRQSVLAAAVSGGLTEEWREDNKQDKVSLSETFSMDSKYLFSVPSCWSLTAIGNATSFQQGLQIAKETRRIFTDENVLPILRTVNYENNFAEDVHYALVDEKSIIAETEDIILSRTGTVGRVLTGFKGIMHNNSFRLNYEKNYLLREYLIFFLKSPICQEYVKENSGRSTQPDLTHKAFAKCPISIPNLEEQTEIVRRVEQLFAYADEIEQRVKDAQTRVNHLTQSILAKAFRGELTTKWRAQNPELISGENSAAALLERIKVERAIASNKRKIKK